MEQWSEALSKYGLARGLLTLETKASVQA